MTQDAAIGKSLAGMACNRDRRKRHGNEQRNGSNRGECKLDRAFHLDEQCLKTACTCARRTPGNHLRNSSTVAPPSMFSNKALTGTRVPLKSHAPLTFSGWLSTSGQSFQSGMMSLYFGLRRFNRRDRSAFRAAFRTGAKVIAADHASTCKLQLLATPAT